MRFSRFCVLGAVGIMTAAAGACGGDDSPAASATTPAPAAVTTTSPAPAPAETTATEAPATTEAPTEAPPAESAESDLSALTRIGIDVDKGVVIDVADDGVDRFMQVGKNGVVDFTGTIHTDSTMMSLKAAPVSAKNRVVIKPPFWNEGAGAGSCVADTSGAALKLETCRSGDTAQIWQVVPAGDSGQFELKGAFGILSVDNGELTTGGGRTGLQTVDFAG
ncbi:hypothetical protein [Paractinoplanes atraurantiacus]|uniref:Ricin B lectin domain-containing protein n=1 Tax=Paractinoplanes atraurantiacus TaxID=1036182 RepID=A0A285GUJ0_9ACTN|nr:hypothetical protein [Actinoplanes atraurantiacus]SNY25971.1 hypothetical protein SAMN05421748_102440 [Actinoplanes atraurantiacus]